jgi:hypothetical protein
LGSLVKRELDFIKFEVFTAVTMKNAVILDIKTQFVPHRRHITSPLQNPDGKCCVRFEYFTAVTMKNALFLDDTDVSEELIASIIRLLLRASVAS